MDRREGIESKGGIAEEREKAKTIIEGRQRWPRRQRDSYRKIGRLTDRPNGRTLPLIFPATPFNGNWDSGSQAGRQLALGASSSRLPVHRQGLKLGPPQHETQVLSIVLLFVLQRHKQATPPGEKSSPTEWALAAPPNVRQGNNIPSPNMYNVDTTVCTAQVACQATP